MPSEQDDRSPQVNQEARSGRDSIVAGRDVHITVVLGNAEKAAEALGDLPLAAAEALQGAPQEGTPRWEAIPRPAVFPGQGTLASAEATAGRRGRMPWAPLEKPPAVRWLDSRPRADSDREEYRIELHVVPAMPLQAQARLTAPALLVDAGRQAGLFPPAATVTPRASGEAVSALLAESAGDPGLGTAGLRIFADGQRTAWLTLHRAAELEEALTKLVKATASIRRGLPKQVAVAVAMDAGPGAVLSAPPRNWLTARYLVSHPQQVAADIGQSLGTKAGTRPSGSSGSR